MGYRCDATGELLPIGQALQDDYPRIRKLELLYMTASMQDGQAFRRAFRSGHCSSLYDLPLYVHGKG